MRKILIIFLSSIAFLVPIFYASASPIKILIVPGHDDESFGAQFKSVKEADMNAKLGLYLYDLLKKDKNFDVSISRNWHGYTPEFSDYFQSHDEFIKKYITAAKSIYKDKITDGRIAVKNGVYHNDVTNEVGQKLYGINLWANQQEVDAVIHIHFNDYPRPHSWTIGNYKGFAIYTPDRQFTGAEASFDLASFIFQSLLKNYAISNYPPESSGIVSDQDLIAVGANDSLNPRRVLIEYGYIYERKFNTFKKRESEMKRMAGLTYDGIRKYFNYISTNR